MIRCPVVCDLKRFIVGSDVAAATVVPTAMQCAKVKWIRTERSSCCSLLTAADCLRQVTTFRQSTLDSIFFPK